MAEADVVIKYPVIFGAVFGVAYSLLTADLPAGDHTPQARQSLVIAGVVAATWFAFSRHRRNQRLQRRWEINRERRDRGDIPCAVCGGNGSYFEHYRSTWGGFYRKCRYCKGTGWI
jgi:hypothetical protein